MKKENENKRFIEMVSKSPKHGNMPKPRYWENIGPKSSRIPTVARKGHCNLFFFLKLSRDNSNLSRDKMSSYRAINEKI